jgi:hypothetical protein
VAQTQRLSVGAGLAAAAAVALSSAQRSLSTPARLLRRQVTGVSGTMTLAEGESRPVDRSTLLGPLEAALRALSWGVVLLAAGLAVTRLG